MRINFLKIETMSSTRPKPSTAEVLDKLTKELKQDPDLVESMSELRQIELNHPLQTKTPASSEELAALNECYTRYEVTFNFVKKVLLPLINDESEEDDDEDKDYEAILAELTKAALADDKYKAIKNLTLDNTSKEEIARIAALLDHSQKELESIIDVAKELHLYPANSPHIPEDIQDESNKPSFKPT